MAVSEHYRPAPRFLELGEGFADPVDAARFPQTILRFRNEPWASRLGLGGLDDEQWRRHFAEFAPLPDNLPRPLALRYHGHQFLTYNPDLGDGRGFLYAQVTDDEGRLLDLGTKGSGTTPYSRGGDGRLTLKGGVREVLATEMLEALGVYTNKSFSLIETGESLIRHDEPSPTRSSVLVRLSHSHIRFGTFQRFATLREFDAMKRLLAYSVQHYLPEADQHKDGRIHGFLEAVVERSAWLAASWMAAGFVHGVLNTDNMNITGESFDYGPYRFLPTYDSSFVAAYFDHGGLYAFGRQPHAVLWNLTQLTESLQNLEDSASLTKPLDEFRHRFAASFVAQFLVRLGVRPRGEDDDVELAEVTFDFLEKSPVAYEQFFFDWFGGPERAKKADQGPAAEHYATSGFAPVRKALARYQPRRPVDHPYFERDTPCTLLIDEIEAIWTAIAERDDWSPFDDKIADIRTMGTALNARASALPPEPLAPIY